MPRKRRQQAAEEYTIASIQGHMKVKKILAGKGNGLTYDDNQLKQSSFQYAFRAHWKGWSSKDDTWQPLETFHVGCSGLLRGYCSKHDIDLPENWGAMLEGAADEEEDEENQDVTHTDSASDADSDVDVDDVIEESLTSESEYSSDEEGDGLDIYPKDGKLAKIVNHVRISEIDDRDMENKHRMDNKGIKSSAFDYVFKVRWEDHSPRRDSWVPIEFFGVDHDDILNAYCSHAHLVLPKDYMKLLHASPSKKKYGDDDLFDTSDITPPKEFAISSTTNIYY